MRKQKSDSIQAHVLLQNQLTRIDQRANTAWRSLLSSQVVGKINISSSLHTPFNLSGWKSSAISGMSSHKAPRRCYLYSPFTLTHFQNLATAHRKRWARKEEIECAIRRRQQPSVRSECVHWSRVVGWYRVIGLCGVGVAPATNIALANLESTCLLPLMSLEWLKVERRGGRTMRYLITSFKLGARVSISCSLATPLRRVTYIRTSEILWGKSAAKWFAMAGCGHEKVSREMKSGTKISISLASCSGCYGILRVSQWQRKAILSLIQYRTRKVVS